MASMGEYPKKDWQNMENLTFTFTVIGEYSGITSEEILMITTLIALTIMTAFYTSFKI